MTTPTETSTTAEAPITTPVTTAPTTPAVETGTPATETTTEPTGPVTIPGDATEAPTETPEAVQEGTEFRYQPTGDAGLDVSLAFFGKLGLGPEDPAITAATNGKFELLEAKLTVLGDKAAGWEQFVALAKDAHQRVTSAEEARTGEIAGVVTKVAAAANVSWDEVKAWAGANATPAEKQAVNAMLTADPVQARAAANMLVELYRNAGGTTIEPQSAVSTTASGGSTSTNNGALSPTQYKAEVAALVAKIGAHRIDSSKEYAALKQRRLAYTG